MKIYLYLPDKLLHFYLPQDISGSFRFDEVDEEQSKLINIDARDNKWILYSTDDVEVIDNGVAISEKELVSNNFYYLKRDNVNYLIYICDISDSAFDIYKYNDNLNVIIGNSDECNVKFSIGNNNGILAKIYNNNGRYYIESNNISLYSNNLHLKEKNNILKFGDVIEIYSFRLIFLNGLLLIHNSKYKNNYVSDLSGLSLINISSGELRDFEIKDISLYSKNDFFSKSPRIRRIIEEKDFKLTAPPNPDNSKESPLFLTIGPMLTMGIISFVTIFKSLSNIFSGKSSFGKESLSLLSSGLMIISMLLWPLIMRKYNKHQKEKSNKELISKYKKYLSEKAIELESEMKLQKEILIENLIDTNECLNILQRKGINFWDKRVDQDDFLLLRIGNGDFPLKVNFNFPEDGFNIDENELKKESDLLFENYRYIKDVPVGYSFLENRISAIMGPINKRYAFINNLILQIITFYSYEDVKIVLFTNKDNLYYWDYIKYLNHSFNNERNFRFFSSDFESGKIISDYLNNEFNYRINCKSEFPKPHYIVITDTYDRIKNYNFIKEITEQNENIGFSLIILEERLSKLPSKCNNFITLGFDNRSGILKNSYEKQEQLYFFDEINYDIDMMKVSKIVSNIPIEFEMNFKNLPESLSFLEMENVGKVEQLNILNRWNTNDSTSSLRAEIGVDEEKSLMYLDLHEKVHGPHGLIAGTTGSGKSEFIITYILSMCINYNPDDVSFVLIDYKGGGLALAFENKALHVVLPHLAGTITNLDKAEMDRTLVSIDSEVKRRQKMFNEARDKLGESTIDIYKYQRLYHEGKLEEPIPHLFIICDEFAELKSQQPDFMDNLISVARIGRSLGVHLILATQKPSGVVNDQIWSNSKFKVCLKVQDASDSNEMIKREDAAYLKQAGRFYLQVGYDEYFALGQSAWCGAKYYPSDKIIKHVDKSINLINDCGLFIRSVEASNGIKIEPKGEQISNILQSIIASAKRINKFSRKLWLDNIPDIILIDDLYKKYNVQSDNLNIEAIIGEYDAPEKQEQGLVKFNYLNDGNTVIYGNDSSECDLLINAIVYSTVSRYSSEDVNFYAIDYGSEFLQKYLKSKYFGGIVINGEDEELVNLLKFLKKEVTKRKKILADFGGEYKYYPKNSDVKMPLLVIIFNNFDGIQENYNYIQDDLFDIVRDSERYGVVYIFTCSAVNAMGSKLSSNFKNIYTLKIKDSAYYGVLLGKNTKMQPRNIFGRGLLKDDDVHEYQTAHIVNEDTKLNEFLSNMIQERNNIMKFNAYKIPILPDFVRFENIKDDISDLRNVPIGIEKKNLEIIKFNFLSSVGNIISSNKIGNSEKFVKSLLYVIKNIKNIALFVFDSMNLLKLDKKDYSNYFIDNFDKIIDLIIENIDKLIEKNEKFEGIIFIYGLDKFVKLVEETKLKDLMNKLKKYEYISIVMIDDSGKIKSYAFESWFSGICSSDEGIWVGKGVSEQNVLRLSSITRDMSADLKNNMGYYVSEGSGTLCKLVDFISKEDDEFE